MKIAMHTWMRVEPLETAIARLSRFGCDAVQIGGEPARCDPRAVRPLLKRYGIPCCGVATLMTDLPASIMRTDDRDHSGCKG